MHFRAGRVCTRWRLASWSLKRPCWEPYSCFTAWSSPLFPLMSFPRFILLLFLCFVLLGLWRSRQWVHLGLILLWILLLLFWAGVFCYGAFVA